MSEAAHQRMCWSWQRSEWGQACRQRVIDSLTAAVASPEPFAFGQSSHTSVGDGSSAGRAPSSLFGQPVSAEAAVSFVPGGFGASPSPFGAMLSSGEHASYGKT